MTTIKPGDAVTIRGMDATVLAANDPRTVTSFEYRKMVSAESGALGERSSHRPFKPVIAGSNPARPTIAPRPGKMNRTEAAYAEWLEWRHQHGNVRAYDFEAIKLRLADRTFYRPDFLVTMADGSIEIHEVKGFMRDDAAVKLKVAARLFPCFRFVVVRARTKRLSDGFTTKDVSDGL